MTSSCSFEVINNNYRILCSNSKPLGLLMKANHRVLEEANALNQWKKQESFSLFLPALRVRAKPLLLLEGKNLEDMEHEDQEIEQQSPPNEEAMEAN